MSDHRLPSAVPILLAALLWGCYGPVGSLADPDPEGQAPVDLAGLTELDAAALIEAVASDREVPPDLLAALAWTESSFVPVDPRHDERPSGSGWLALSEDEVALGAALTGLDPALVAQDRAAGLLAGAAILEQLRAEHAPDAQPDLADERWWPALEAWADLGEDWLDDELAFAVFETLQRGQVAQTAEGDEVVIEARDLPGLAAIELAEPPSEGEARSGSVDYPGARWVAASSDNQSTRSGGTAAIEKVVLHTIEGTAASAISWFRNADSGVSAHYVVRRSDGQVTQMVRDADKAWHCYDGNGDSVGIEHEGHAHSSSTWTPTMVESSARLGAWLSATYDIPVDRDHFVAHYEVPGNEGWRTDPGPYFPWDLYLDLVRCYRQGGGEACTAMIPEQPGLAATDAGTGGTGDDLPTGTTPVWPGAEVRFEVPRDGDVVGNPVLLRARRTDGHHVEFWAGAYRVRSNLLANPAHVTATFGTIGPRRLKVRAESAVGTLLASDEVLVTVVQPEGTLTPRGTPTGGLTWDFLSEAEGVEPDHVRYAVDGYTLFDDATASPVAPPPQFRLTRTFSDSGEGRMLVGRAYDADGRLVAEGFTFIDVVEGAAAECLVAGTLACGDVVTGDTAGSPLATDVLDGYPELVGTYDGPELGFAFEAAAGHTVELRLVDAVPTELDHDLLVLDRSTGACAAADMVASGFNSLEFVPEHTGLYTVVVDGYDGAAGPFTLELNCPW